MIDVEKTNSNWIWKNKIKVFIKTIKFGTLKQQKHTILMVIKVEIKLMDRD